MPPLLQADGGAQPGAELTAADAHDVGLALLESTLDWVCVIDDAGLIQFTNAAGADAIGHDSLTEMLGGSWVACWHDRDAARRAMELALGGVVGRFTARSTGGDPRWYEVTVAPMPRTPERLLAVGRDVTARLAREEDLRRTTAELRAANHELSQANHELQHLTVFAAHDLQEPLRLVDGFLALLKRRCQERMDAAGRGYLDFAAEATRRMGGLLDDLLRYARSTRGWRPLAPVASADALADALVQLRVRIDRAGATVTHGPMPTVLGDRPHLAQLFQNLLVNALAFRGEAAPAISVTAERDGARWVVSVADNGIGIPAEWHGRIFEMFPRVPGVGDAAGTGLGLSLCKRIVERHQGRIWVESRPGCGATFRFTLTAA